MNKFFLSFLRDDIGSAAAEYALILALICTGIAVAATTLGGAVSTAITNASNKI